MGAEGLSQLGSRSCVSQLGLSLPHPVVMEVRSYVLSSWFQGGGVVVIPVG